jgi:hypothetical protein
MATTEHPTFSSFAEFYPFYLGEHQDRTCRRLHFAGSSIALVCLILLIFTGNLWWLLGQARAAAGTVDIGAGAAAWLAAAIPRSPVANTLSSVLSSAGLCN